MRVDCVYLKVTIVLDRFNYMMVVFVHQPSWTMSIQVMTFEQAESFGWNPFDLTKVL